MAIYEASLLPLDSLYQNARQTQVMKRKTIRRARSLPQSIGLHDVLFTNVTLKGALGVEFSLSETRFAHFV